MTIHRDEDQESLLRYPLMQWAQADFFQSAFNSMKLEHTWLQTNSARALRNKYLAMLKEFEALLEDADTKEEVLQKFLTLNVELIAPGYRRVLPKQQFGKTVSDFVIEDHVGHYLLVELERATAPLFTRKGDLSSELNHAVGQILDWTRYIQDNRSTVEKELGLPGISSTPRGLVVIGRSKSLSEGNRNKLRVRASDSRIEILTYDDLCEKFRALVGNLIGSLEHADQPYDILYRSPSQTQPDD